VCVCLWFSCEWFIEQCLLFFSFLIPLSYCFASQHRHKHHKDPKTRAGRVKKTKKKSPQNGKGEKWRRRRENEKIPEFLYLWYHPHSSDSVPNNEKKERKHCLYILISNHKVTLHCSSLPLFPIIQWRQRLFYYTAVPAEHSTELREMEENWNSDTHTHTLTSCLNRI